MFKNNPLKLIIISLCFLVAGCTSSKVNNDDVLIVFTNDVHCSYKDNVGYAGLKHYVENSKKLYKNVTLVDAGDFTQGDAIGLVSEGAYMVEMMNEVGYDIATLGNHEFDYGMDSLKRNIDNAKFEVIAANVKYTGKRENKLEKLKPYIIKDYGSMKIGFIGTVTPATSTSSNPKTFIEDGQVAYSFYGGNEGKDYYSLIQKTVDEVKSQVDLVVLIGHLGIDPIVGPYTSNLVVKNTTGIDVVIDAHSHNDFIQNVENENKEKVLVASTGSNFKSFGILKINKNKDMTSGLIYKYDLKDSEMNKKIDVISKKCDEKLNVVIGHSLADVSINYGNTDFRAVRNRETTMGNLVTDAILYTYPSDFCLVNGGSIRNNIKKGDVTYKNVIDVLPYFAYAAIVEATGLQVLNYLEFAVRNTKTAQNDGKEALGEFGGFTQASHIKFNIKTTIDSPVHVDGEGNFDYVEGERRIKNVQIQKEDGQWIPLTEDGKYTFTGVDFVLASGGDGVNIFKYNKFILNQGVSMADCLFDYIDFLENKTIPESYGNLQNRINIIL